jgi:hypothetical protein
MVGRLMDDILAEQAAALLQRHARGDLDNDGVVQELAASDPRLGLLAGLLSRQSVETETGTIADLQAQLASANQLADEAGQLAEGLRLEFDGLVQDVGGLRSRLDDLAAALGACPGCWGDDSSCGWCRGRGAPGALPPDPDAFRRLVRPALQRRADVRPFAQPGESDIYD